MGLASLPPATLTAKPLPVPEMMYSSPACVHSTVALLGLMMYRCVAAHATRGGSTHHSAAASNAQRSSSKRKSF